MDSLHDLGGVEGFGPIKVETAYIPFHEAWEGRGYALCSASNAPDWTIDWWRHIREATPAVDYLTTPYFASWAVTQAVGLVDSGILTLDEIASGQPAGPRKEPPAPASLADVLAADKADAIRYDRQIDQTAKFVIGDRVRTARHGAAGHTRLPAYVRGFTGEIVAHHGAHILPDASAAGIEKAEHLYSVAFHVTDLFADAKGASDRVFLDLWESYLRPADG